MSALASSVPMLTNDLRATSIDRLRDKKRKTRYRNTNMAEVGRADPIFEEREPTWNDRNKFKMSPRYQSCKCSYCHPDSSRHRKNHIRLAQDARDDYCEFKGNPNYSTYEADDGTVPGVLYSYTSRRNPTAGNDILSQALGKAVEKHERKELEKLVREEYDIVEEVDTDDSLGSGSDDDYELV